MDTFKEYTGRIWFMFMRVNAQIINVKIHETFSLGRLPAEIKIKIFNDLGISTDREYVSISHEDAESLVGLLTTLGITFTQSTGNPPHGTTNTV